MPITLSLVFFFNIIGLVIFLHFARRKKIVDTPNERSSHQKTTVRGGGLLFTPTFVIIILLYYPNHYLAAIALLLASIVSFLDDIYSLPIRIRLPIHFISVILILYETSPNMSIVFFVSLLVVITGWVNTFNFMDGINGITMVYGIIFLGTFYYISSPNLDMLNLSMLLSLAAFGFFNFKKKALCFAGDIGSISLALIIAWVFFETWVNESSLFMLTFPAIYGIDSVLTILIRIKKKENILEAHRSHLYQLLANDIGKDHRLIALVYGGIQLFINFVFIFLVSSRAFYFQFVAIVVFYIIACFIYLFIRVRLEESLGRKLI